MELGFHLGVTGVVTFSKATELVDIVKAVPLESLLVETDGPYLAPMPHRGKRNEPAFVKIVAQKIADLKGVRLEDVAGVTTMNVSELFKVNLPDSG